MTLQCREPSQGSPEWMSADMGIAMPRTPKLRPVGCQQSHHPIGPGPRGAQSFPQQPSRSVMNEYQCMQTSNSSALLRELCSLRLFPTETSARPSHAIPNKYDQLAGFHLISALLYTCLCVYPFLSPSVLLVGAPRTWHPREQSKLTSLMVCSAQSV